MYRLCSAIVFVMILALAPNARADSNDMRQAVPEAEEATQPAPESDEAAAEEEAPSPGFIVPGEEEMPPEAEEEAEASAREAGAETAESETKPAEEQPREGVKILRKEGVAVAGAPYSVLGASTLGEDDSAIRVAFGYPELQAFYQFAWTQAIDISLGANFFYGLNPKTAGDVMGVAALFEARWKFWNDGPHTLALTASPAFYGIFDPDAAFGLILGLPGIDYDFEIAGRHHAVLGFNAPWGFFFHDSGVSARVPLLFKMAMEFAVTDTIHVFVSSEVGADIWAGDYIDDTYLYVRALGGAAFQL